MIRLIQRIEGKKTENGPLKRKCLVCGKSFNSTHRGNRICARCKAKI